MDDFEIVNRLCCRGHICANCLVGNPTKCDLYCAEKDHNCRPLFAKMLANRGKLNNDKEAFAYLLQRFFATMG